MQSHPVSYFGTKVVDDTLQARITRLNNNKLDKTDFFSSPITLTVTNKSTGNTSLSYSTVECYVLGRMVFIKGTISFTKSRNELGASFAISGMPDFPSCFGCNVFSYTLYPEGTFNYSTGYGYYDRSTTVGSTNTILFYRMGSDLTTGVTWWAKFQFFYWY